MTAASQSGPIGVPEARHFKAPARVNIIGEHTDYNDGLVMPMNTALFTTASIAPRPGPEIVVHAHALNETHSFAVTDATAGRQGGWTAYVQGVIAVLLQEGIDLPGSRIDIHSTIPLGGGLSSSASLELALSRALLEQADAHIDARRLATLCRRVEVEYAGVNCGIMDQYSVSCGKYGEAMMLDCRTMQSEYVEIPETLAFIVTDTGVKHELSAGQYNERARECREAVAEFAALNDEITALRDVSTSLLDRARAQLGDVLFRRSRHVVSEIGRVREMFSALKDSDTTAVGQLLTQSHDSLRDDFEVSCAESDKLVELADRCGGVLGSRMVGAGFGGCVLSAVRASAADNALTEISERFSNEFGRSPWIHRVVPAGPAAEVKLN